MLEEILSLLKEGINNSNWADVEDALELLENYIEENDVDDVPFQF